ncbi:MAG: hypothetical protein GWO10_08845, partial [candidate division Zixibacteria bacterium]|nr:hypothetical protein [candidate division Zixibacteria bacterium]NIX00025.1 hypothetical protein [Phycisphaerae bacterium]
TPDASYQITFTGISFGLARDYYGGTIGPANYVLRYSTDGGSNFDDLTSGTLPASDLQQVVVSLDLSGSPVTVSGEVIFRLYG